MMPRGEQGSRNAEEVEMSELIRERGFAVGEYHLTSQR